MELAATLTVKKKGLFLKLVYGQGFSPKEASERIGVKYERMLLEKAQDPLIAQAWDNAISKTDNLTVAKIVKNSQASAETHKARLRDLLFGEADFGGKIVGIIKAANIKTPEGRDTIAMYVRYGLVRDLLPKEVMQKNQDIPFSRVEGLTEEELRDLIWQYVPKLKEAIENKERAAKQRVKLSGIGGDGQRRTDQDPRGVEEVTQRSSS